LWSLAPAPKHQFSSLTFFFPVPFSFTRSRRVFHSLGLFCPFPSFGTVFFPPPPPPLPPPPFNSFVLVPLFPSYLVLLLSKESSPTRSIRPDPSKAFPPRCLFFHLLSLNSVPSSPFPQRDSLSVLLFPPIRHTKGPVFLCFPKYIVLTVV